MSRSPAIERVGRFPGAALMDRAPYPLDGACGGDPMQVGGKAAEEQRQRRPASYGRRISATEWKRLGGLRNGRLYRVQAANGRWRYYDGGE